MVECPGCPVGGVRGGKEEVRMGTDIHGWVEIRPRGDVKAPWVKESKVPDDRNYILFDALADGRGNGNVKPVVEPRGLAGDYVYSRECGTYCGCREMESGRRADDHYTTDWWVEGGHGHTWYDLRELAAEPGWDQVFYEWGWISRERYIQWVESKRSSAPYPYSKGIDGGRVVHACEADCRFHIREHEPGGWTHIRVSWTEKLSDRCAAWVEWMNDTVEKYQDHDIRIVIGF